jgi:hypothetical protein
MCPGFSQKMGTLDKDLPIEKINRLEANLEEARKK